MFRNIRKNFPNIYIFIVGICVACWFKGINIIINSLIKKDNIYIAIGLISISTLILYLDDGSLRELKNIGGTSAINMTNNHNDF